MQEEHLLLPLTTTEIQRELLRKYPSDRLFSTGIIVSLDVNGIPIQSSFPERLSTSRTQDVARRTQLEVSWDDLPFEIQSKFEPLLKVKKNGNGYSNVNSQPGMGDGYQVQKWCSSIQKHTRLGTVKCEKVGALMLAASVLDPYLATKRLVCKDWLLRMISEESFRRDWLSRH